MRIDMPVLRTGRISIEPFRAGDEDALLAGSADPLVAQFAGLGWSGLTRADLRRMIEERWPALREEGRAAISALRDAETGAVLGYLPLFDLNWVERRAEIGYWLMPSSRGRGVATEAVAAVVAWAFADLGLLRVQGVVDVANVASQRVLERAGFEREGVLRSFKFLGDGTRGDAVLFSRVHTAEPRPPVRPLESDT